MTETRKLLERVPPEAELSGPSWLAEVRREAARSLRDVGLPHKKSEAWRFTPIRPIVDTAFADATSAELPDWIDGRLDPADGTARIYMVNGRPSLPAELPEGVRAARLSELLEKEPEAVAAQLGQVAPREHFAALNAALFDDGLVLWIGRGKVVETPLHVVHVSEPGAEATACYPRLLVVGGENSECQLVESYLGGDGAKQLTNAVTEIVLERAARLEHTRVQMGGEGSHHVGQLAVKQDADSVYRSRSVSLGGAFARLDIRVRMEGQGAECQLDGVYHTYGKEVCDHHTWIDHVASHCSSSENYRGIVDGASHAIFDGTIIVHRDAQQSSAHQENRNLLLSDDATIHTKPHLEIDADDIVASHGATVGALDDDQLFYLRTRGIEEEQARAALTYGFVQALIEPIAHAPVAAWLGRTLRDRLPEGARIEELLS